MWSWWDCMRLWESAWNSGLSDSSFSWIMFLPMMVWPLAVIGGIALLVILLVRNGRSEQPSGWHHDPGGHTAFDVLRERFARGEIDRQEYEERKTLLSRP